MHKVKPRNYVITSRYDSDTVYLHVKCFIYTKTYTQTMACGPKMADL